MNRKICVVTGSRAEYGLLRWVMEGIGEASGLQLQIVATGMHLSPEFGLTFRAMEDDGFHIDRKVEMLLSSDTPIGVSKSMGLGLIGFADVLNELKPDIIVLLGDRFEVFAAATAALVARIPVAHLSGGEVTQGAFDEALRHSITKMSHLHFVAADEYRDRVIQLGEDPDTVFMVEGLGVDAISHVRPLEREDLERQLGFDFLSRNLLVTFHPATLDGGDPGQQLSQVLSALETVEDTGLIFTLPNADTGSRNLIDLVNSWVRDRPHARAYASLGQLRYLSCLRHVDGVVGNSSSGLTEVPTFGKGTINIGDRQAGRLRAASVIDCEPDRSSIVDALQTLFSPGFQEGLRSVRNPYGDGGASERIVQVLCDHSLESILKKSFHDLTN